MLRRVEKDKFDADGIEMRPPSRGTYQALEDFLLEMNETLFAFLVSGNGSGNIERIPDGTIIVDWRYNRKIVLGVSLGDDYMNFFYAPKKGTGVLGETKSVKELLENKDFISAVQHFLEKFNKNSETVNIVGPINKFNVDLSLTS